MRLTIIFCFIASLLLGFSLTENKRLAVIDDNSVQEVLMSLGEEAPSHYIASPDPNKQEIGRQLVYNGRTKLQDGSYSNFISKFYVCTDCHNQVREDPVLPKSDPDARLDYVKENELKFLQSTTFWAMVNRESWYNDDYVLKYGAMVEPAHESLAEATQLCAQECSSGRYLEDWELESIMQYYWSLELKMEDLDLTNAEYNRISSAINNESERAGVIQLLKSKYLLASPATFVQDDPKAPVEKLTGNAERGELIWDLSCEACHREYGPSQLILDQSKFTFNKFKKHLDRNTNFNLFHITRHGTYAEPGHRQYMPLYPLERMSHQQIADLKAFILAGAR